MQTMEPVGEKPNNPKITRDNINRHLVEYQLAMVGKTMMDTLDDDRWFFNITMTREQHNQFKLYAVKLIRKTFKCNKLKGELRFDAFNQALGLRIKN
jgi:hypothetical protein